MKEENQSKISEMSAMAAGSVEGSAAPKQDEPEDYFISREKFLQELQLREVVRKMITISEQKHKKSGGDENTLRKLINKLITEAETDTTPHASTAINFLEDLLKKILPNIEQDYKSLTTNAEQRESFRAQFVSSVNSSLETADLNIQAAKSQEGEVEGFIEIEEAADDVKIDVVDDEKFIDIEGGPAVEEETENEAADTGSKLAAQSFDAVEKQISETYSTLSEEEDQTTFKDYLITNLKLYFDKWEKELGDVVEPTTDEYEAEKEEDEIEDLGAEDLGEEEEFEL